MNFSSKKYMYLEFFTRRRGIRSHVTEFLSLPMLSWHLLVRSLMQGDRSWYTSIGNNLLLLTSCPSFYRSFGAKCSKCCRGISASDWVRKAREQVYHLACFACDACGRQLSTGEQFALHEDRVLCKPHYLETLDGGSISSDGKYNCLCCGFY